MAGSMVYRLRISSPSDPHMALFMDGMNAIQGIWDNRGFNHVAGHHGFPGGYCWHHQSSGRSQVQARLFLPWHRAYLWDLEQKLQDQADRAALPWWGWTTDRGIPLAYESTPLDSFTARLTLPDGPIEYTTERGTDPNRFDWLPTTQDVDDLLEEADWATFSDTLTGHHDTVHGVVGGSMGSVATAAYDPVFFAHHCMVDRIWYLWQLRHGNSGIPDSLMDIALDPFAFTVRQVLDVQTLGYEYAATAAEIPAPVEEEEGDG